MYMYVHILLTCTLCRLHVQLKVRDSKRRVLHLSVAQNVPETGISLGSGQLVIGSILKLYGDEDEGWNWWNNQTSHSNESKPVWHHHAYLNPPFGSEFWALKKPTKNRPNLGAEISRPNGGSGDFFWTSKGGEFDSPPAPPIWSRLQRGGGFHPSAGFRLQAVVWVENTQNLYIFSPPKKTVPTMQQSQELNIRDFYWTKFKDNPTTIAWWHAKKNRPMSKFEHQKSVLDQVL